jgi:hypothetical protein
MNSEEAPLNAGLVVVQATSGVIRLFADHTAPVEYELRCCAAIEVFRAPFGFSSRLITVAFTIFAIGNLSCRMACVS